MRSAPGRGKDASEAKAGLARWRPPGACAIPPAAPDLEARRLVADYVGRAQDFKRFVKDSAAGRLREEDAVPWAVLAPELLRTTGTRNREVPLYSWAAGHAWRRHGPQAMHGKTWERMQWSDWLLAQRVVDEAAPELQPNGRWRFSSGSLLRLHRPVGFSLIAEAREGVLTPITWFRIGL